jgi:predicted DsbA family dithiol-disulfide isomerase
MARRHEVPMRLPTISPQPYTELAFRGAQYALEQSRADVYHGRVMTAMDITVVPAIIIGARRIEGVAAEGVIRRALHEASVARART